MRPEKNYNLRKLSRRNDAQKSNGFQLFSNALLSKLSLTLVIIVFLSGLISAQTHSDGATDKMTTPGAPAGSYALSGFENVNLFNGNLNFNLPLAKIGGRGKAQSAISLAIDSARWSMERDSTSQSMVQASVGASGKYRSNEGGTMSVTSCPSHYEYLPCNEMRTCRVRVADAGGVCDTGSAFDSNNAVPDGSMLINGVGAPGYNYYVIREDLNLSKPGYGPGRLVARGGKFGGTAPRVNPAQFFSLTRIYFVAPNGTEYELRDASTNGEPKYHYGDAPFSRGQIFVSADGAGLRFVADAPIADFWVSEVMYAPPTQYPSGTLYFADGTKYLIENGNVKRIRDIDGNQITYTYTEQGMTVVDSLGRQTTVTYNLPANDPADADLTYDKISTQTGSDSWQTVKIYRTKLERVLRSGFQVMNFPQMFPEVEQLLELSSGDYNPGGVVKKVELPDGKSYEFQYTPYNEIARVKLPTGGAIEYDFPMPAALGTPGWEGTIFRPVLERREYANGGSGAAYNNRQKFRRNEIAPYPNYESEITVDTFSKLEGETSEKPETESKHFFYGKANAVQHRFYSNWKEGKEYKSETYTSTSELKQRTETEWANPVTISWGDTAVGNKTQVNSVTNTIFENGKSLTSKASYEYDNASITNNKTDERTFDYGTNGAPGRLLKHSVTSYLKVNPANTMDYASDNIYLLGIPEKSELYDVKPNNTEVLIAKSETKFDEGAYAPATYGGTFTGWVDPNTSVPIRGSATTSQVWSVENGAAVGSPVQTHAQFDQFGNPRKAWDAAGRMSEVQYDSAFGYAFPTKTITPAPDPNNTGHGTNQAFETTATYDFYTGLVKTATDANGQTATTEYDNLLRPTHVIPPAGGSEVYFDYGDSLGDLYVKTRKRIDQTNWDEATTFLDAMGRAVKTKAKDSQGDVFTETKYDGLGRVKQVSSPYREGDQIYWTKTKVDDLGRTVETFAPAINVSQAQSTGTTAYDLATAGDAIGTVVAGTNAAGRTERSVTNALGQLIRVDEPSFDNKLDALPAPTPTPTSTPSPTPTPGGGGGGGCYAAINRCNNGNSVETDYPSVSTYYKYDPLGKMTAVTQGGQQRFFLYDGLGRMTRVRQPEQEVNPALQTTGNTDNNLWTAGFTYDVSGNIKTATDAKGVRIITDYDNLNRVTTRCYTIANASTNASSCSQLQNENQNIDPNTPQVNYKYDGLTSGNAPAPPPEQTTTGVNYPKGKLTEVSNGISATQYTFFDNLGRLRNSQQLTDGQVYPSSYKYSLSGQMTEQKYPSGRVVVNTFESDGDLAAIESRAKNRQFSNYAGNFSYTATGVIERLQLGNGRWETAKLNSRQQITELALGTSPTDTSLWKVNYDYGELASNGIDVDETKNDGNIAKQTISFNGLANPFVQTYKYDSVNRLTEARETTGANGVTQTWKQNWNYDRYGNRTSFNQLVGSTPLVLDNKTNPSIDQTTNRFTSGQDYTYDKNGNVTADPDGKHFYFNGDNKQTEVITSGGSTVGKYFYDGDGKRVKKIGINQQGEQETTIFVYSGGQLIAEYSTATPTTNPTTSYTATDPLGSPRAITNAQGEVISRRDFMPFGEELYPDEQYRKTNDKYGVIDSVRQRFTGYEKDIETGLDFAEARYYNNQHARFTAVDPLLASGKSANPQTFNRYSYAIGNPLAYTDHTGLQVGTHIGNVYTDEKETRYARKPFDGSHQFEGAKYVEGEDGFTYSVNTGGFYSIGNTADIHARAESFSMADSRTRELAYANSSLPSSWTPELQFDPPGYAEASHPGGGRFAVTADGDTNPSAAFLETDRQRAFATAVIAVELLGGAMPGGNGEPPKIPRGFLFTGEASSGSNFGEKLFLTETFGKDSKLFGNSRFDLSGSKREGLFNQSSSNFKVGWSYPQVGGGWQFRFGVLAIPDSRRARFHFDVPRTFVPNSFADPYQFRPAKKTP